MGFLVYPLIALFLLVVMPLALIALIAGPKRTSRFLNRFWAGLFGGPEDPARVFDKVVHGHQRNIRTLRGLLEQSREIQAEIARDLRRCQEAIPGLEREAKNLVARGDDQGARAILSRLHLERNAAASFREQQAQQSERITQTQRRLHLLELQLRQYELNRRILLNQLAEARTLEQQYTLANQFDPDNAIGAWMRTEGIVEEEVENVRALEQVHREVADLPLGGRPAKVDSASIEAELAHLKTQTGPEQTTG
jgi:phage shock protein A